MESERIFTTGAREKCNYINREPLKLSLPMDWMEGKTRSRRTISPPWFHPMRSVLSLFVVYVKRNPCDSALLAAIYSECNLKIGFSLPYLVSGTSPYELIKEH